MIRAAAVSIFFCRIDFSPFHAVAMKPVAVDDDALRHADFVFIST